MKKLLYTTAILLTISYNLYGLSNSTNTMSSLKSAEMPAQIFKKTYQAISPDITFRNIFKSKVLSCHAEISNGTTYDAVLTFEEYIPDTEYFSIIMNISPEFLKKYPYLQRYYSNLLRPLEFEINIWKAIIKKLSPECPEYYNEIDSQLKIINEQSESEKITNAFLKIHQLIKNAFSCLVSDKKISELIPQIKSEEITSCTRIPTISLLSLETYNMPKSSKKNCTSVTLFTKSPKYQLNYEKSSLPLNILEQTLNQEYNSSFYIILPNECVNQSEQFFEVTNQILYCLDLRNYLHREVILSWNTFRIYTLNCLINNEKKLREKITNSKANILLNEYFTLPETNLIKSGQLKPITSYKMTIASPDEEKLSLSSQKSSSLEQAEAIMPSISSPQSEVSEVKDSNPLFEKIQNFIQSEQVINPITFMDSIIISLAEYKTERPDIPSAELLEKLIPILKMARNYQDLTQKANEEFSKQHKCDQKIISDTLAQLVTTQKNLKQYQEVVGQVKSQLHEEQKKISELNLLFEKEQKNNEEILKQLNMEKQKTREIEKEKKKLEREKREAFERAKREESAKNQYKADAQRNLQKEKEKNSALQKNLKEITAELETIKQLYKKEKKSHEEVSKKSINFEEELNKLKTLLQQNQLQAQAEKEEHEKIIADFQAKIELLQQQNSNIKTLSMAAHINAKPFIPKNHQPTVSLQKENKTVFDDNDSLDSSITSFFSSSTSISSSIPAVTPAQDQTQHQTEENHILNAALDPTQQLQPTATSVANQEWIPLYSQSANPSTTAGSKRSISPAPIINHRTTPWLAKEQQG